MTHPRGRNVGVSCSAVSESLTSAKRVSDAKVLESRFVRRINNKNRESYNRLRVVRWHPLNEEMTTGRDLG
jgi:hypothetical protein